LAPPTILTSVLGRLTGVSSGFADAGVCDGAGVWTRGDDDADVGVLDGTPAVPRDGATRAGTDTSVGEADSERLTTLTVARPSAVRPKERDGVGRLS
jgi:hypothetical protein